MVLLRRHLLSEWYGSWISSLNGIVVRCVASSHRGTAQSTKLLPLCHLFMSVFVGNNKFSEMLHSGNWMFIRNKIGRSV